MCSFHSAARAEVTARAGNKLLLLTGNRRGVWESDQKSRVEEFDLQQEQQLEQRKRLLEGLRQLGVMMGEWGW